MNWFEFFFFMELCFKVILKVKCRLMIEKSQWLRLRVTGFFVFIGHVLWNTWKEVKKAFRCRSLVYKGIYFNIQKYRFITSCESQKTNQSELFCFPWEQILKKWKLKVKRMMLFYLIIKHLIYFQHFQVRKKLIKIRPKWDLWSNMDAQNVHLGTGPGNFYLNPFLLSSLLNDLDKRSDHCPCQGYLGVKVHPAIFDDIGDLYALLTQVGFTY